MVSEHQVLPVAGKLLTFGMAGLNILKGPFLSRALYAIFFVINPINLIKLFIYYVNRLAWYPRRSAFSLFRLPPLSFILYPFTFSLFPGASAPSAFKLPSTAAGACLFPYIIQTPWQSFLQLDNPVCEAYNKAL